MGLNHSPETSQWGKHAAIYRAGPERKYVSIRIVTVHGREFFSFSGFVHSDVQVIYPVVPPLNFFYARYSTLVLQHFV